MLLSADGTWSHAVLDKTGQYRYWLWRLWDADLPHVCFCMLNPSKADAVTDDPTLRRCINFAKSWGYGSLSVVNLFAYQRSQLQLGAFMELSWNKINWWLVC